MKKKEIEWCEKVFDMEHSLLCVTIIVELIPGIDQRDKFFFFKNSTVIYHKIQNFKGSLTRDFRLQVFFINQCPPGP
jgi:hypothetical protein